MINNYTYLQLPVRIHPSRLIIFFLLLLSVGLSSCKKKHAKRILVFSKTVEYRHVSIETGKLAFIDLGNKNGFAVDTTEDASSFSENNLKKYSAVVFLNTTGDVLDFHQQASFERYIQAGGGFVGIHAATDTEYNWPWYGKLVGAYINGQPEIQKATVHVKDHDHVSTKGLPDEWKRTDEWYNFKDISNKLHVLLLLDENTYKGGTNGSNHPISWYQEYDGGRAFYCGGGHTEESYKDSLFLAHILGGIEYAIGDNERDYSSSKTTAMPEQNRFSKTIIATTLDEPTELAVAPDGKVFFIERGGRVLLYDPKTNVTRAIHQLNVFDDLEDGLLGIAVDPNYSFNKRIFLFYSPAGEIAVQHISSFTFDGNLLDTTSERIVIKIPTQRKECCHSAGSLAFDSDGNLLIAVGDNTDSHSSSGYSAQDERPGREAFDSQRTSANTHDLRGKILRIHPLPDGTYTIPEGNLFPKDGSKGRPEIYTMGVRNPYRITINRKNNYLYWGDVGPDSGKDGLQGPQGYDEINEARKAGNFGWPYFIGDNKAYPQFNFATEEIGETNNPEKPTNFSVNNTGDKVLPPAQKPIIWYTYSDSKAFPSLGKGGRTAMTGPFYFFNDYKNDMHKFPKYYDSTMIVYDWMRDLATAARFDKKGHLQSLEPLFSTVKLHHPIDMEFSPDGTLYVLEYGQNWFAANPEASLSRIDYHRGNRPPVAEVAISDSAGTLPLTISFSGKGSYDFDSDDLIYEWRMEGKNIVSRDRDFKYTFTKHGIFYPSLTVTDPSGARTTASVKIASGNSLPDVKIKVNGNSRFYWDNTSLTYEVQVHDKEDQIINPRDINVWFDYLPEGQDMANIYIKHNRDINSSPQITNSLILKSDCKACHSVDKKSIGPSFLQIASKYENTPNVLNTLADKIIKGGGGIWSSQHAMSAHPDLSVGDAKEMVRYILGLGADKMGDGNMAPKGQINFDKEIKEENGIYFLTAEYKDKGGFGLPSSKGSTVIPFRYYIVKTSAADINFKCTNYTTSMEFKHDNAYFAFKDLDLAEISKIRFQYSSINPSSKVEIRKGGPNGKLLDVLEIPNTGIWSNFQWLETKQLNEPGLCDLYFVCKYTSAPASKLAQITKIEFLKK